MQDLIFGEMGKDFIVFLQSFSPSLDFFFNLITNLGNQIIFIGLIGLIYYCVSKRNGLLILFLLTCSMYINVLIKGIIGLPRPYETYPKTVIKPLATDTGYSFPSGHAQSSTTFYAYIAYLLRNNKYKNLIILAVVLIIGVVALSRVYLGVHYPSDVIGGIIVGLIVIGLFLWLEPKIESFFQKQNEFMIVTAALLVSFILVLGSTIFTSITSHSLITEPNGQYPGLLAGVIIGVVLEHKYINFTIANISLNMKILRIVVGIIIMAPTYFLGKIMFNSFELSNLVIVTDYIRYFVLGIIAMAIGPAIFTTLEKLIQKSNH